MRFASAFFRFLVAALGTFLGVHDKATLSDVLFEGGGSVSLPSQHHRVEKPKMVKTKFPKQGMVKAQILNILADHCC